MDTVKIKKEIIKLTPQSRIAFKILKWIDKHISKNKYGLVSGWWQCWKYDRWAFEFINRVCPTEKFWLTKEIDTKFYFQLCDTDELVVGASNPVIRCNEKGDREAIFHLILWCGAVQISCAKFIFIEKEHNYCKVK